MSQFLKICAASVLLAASSFAAQAADAPQAPASIDGQVAVRDSETGELRAPTASEYQTLQANKATLRPAAMRPLSRKAHVSGATGARLTDEFMSYSVMIKQPDGRLVEYCFEDAAAAKSGTQAPVVTINKLPTE